MLLYYMGQFALILNSKFYCKFKNHLYLKYIIEYLIVWNLKIMEYIKNSKIWYIYK